MDHLNRNIVEFRAKWAWGKPIPDQNLNRNIVEFRVNASKLLIIPPIHLNRNIVEFREHDKQSNKDQSS